MSQGEEGTDSPTINVFTVFLALAISAKRKMHKVVYDVAGAYLNADLKTPEYMPGSCVSARWTSLPT